MTGRWLARELPWHETAVLNCPVCGRLITRRSWAFDGGAGEIRVCEPSCEELYESYWKPSYGILETHGHH